MTAQTLYIVGANAGLGEAIAEHALLEGHRVALLGRSGAIREIAARLHNVVAAECDVSSEASIEHAFSELERQHGHATTVIYNAAVVTRANVLDLGAAEFERLWRVNSLGAFMVAKRAVSRMVERGGGTMIFSGATASVRGGKSFAAFASSKFAQRALAQSLAREVGPRGVHVVHVLIDGLVWSERSVQRFGAKQTDCIDPVELAKTYLWLMRQPRSCWTHELDVRPDGANLGTL